MPDSKDGSAHLDGLAQDAPDAPREHIEPSATPQLFRDPSNGNAVEFVRFGDEYGIVNRNEKGQAIGLTPVDAEPIIRDGKLVGYLVRRVMYVAPSLPDA